VALFKHGFNSWFYIVTVEWRYFIAKMNYALGVNILLRNWLTYISVGSRS
jgi:hypothetical protein